MFSDFMFSKLNRSLYRPPTFDANLPYVVIRNEKMQRIETIQGVPHITTSKSQAVLEAKKLVIRKHKSTSQEKA